MSRDAFRSAVFKRDRNRCVMCGEAAVDAHHILDRKLFPCVGYDVDNGASLCGACHLDAETTRTSPEDIREAAGIRNIVLPDTLRSDVAYDKWGNQMNPDATRSRGPLFRDEGARKALLAGGVLYDGTFGWDA